MSAEKSKQDAQHATATELSSLSMSSVKQGRGHWAYAFFIVQQRILSFFSTSLMRFRLKWWQVEGGAKATYFGLTRICRHPSATIRLGRHLMFRSAASSNTVGLKQACFLSASRRAFLHIGDDCGFSGTVISASQQIYIGSRVLCGANVTICDSDRHPLIAAQRHLPANEQERLTRTAPIHIEDDVFIGMNAIVLKGVTIGAGAVVAANAVVTRTVPAGAIVAGNPARIVGYTADWPAVISAVSPATAMQATSMQCHTRISSDGNGPCV